MDVSVHSFLRMIRLAEPLMPEGGTCLSVSLFGSSHVVSHYNMMGPVKAALESAVRYAAAELGEKGISVHALSPGPLKTRAASGIDHFDALITEATERAPMHQLVSIEDVGAYAAFLASREARNITGGVHDIDAGFSITARALEGCTANLYDYLDPARARDAADPMRDMAARRPRRCRPRWARPPSRARWARCSPPRPRDMCSG